MAWRPSRFLMDGELDNTVPGRVTGWMRFAGLEQKTTFDLAGDFHRDIRGAKVQLRGAGAKADPANAAEYMAGWIGHQEGKVGDITAGKPPCDYVNHPYVEWYSGGNGRVVVELQADQVTVVGTPIPFDESDPVSRELQQQNMAEFMGGVIRDLEGLT